MLNAVLQVYDTLTLTRIFCEFGRAQLLNDGGKQSSSTRKLKDAGCNFAKYQ